jgi:hypothetical protein
MGMHREVMVKVNASVDEGIAELVVALSEIDGLETLESCQGHDGERDAFVVFSMPDWRTCGEFLFNLLLPGLGDRLRLQVSLRMEAYDTEVVRGWITLNPDVIGIMTECVRHLVSQTGLCVVPEDMKDVLDAVHKRSSGA